MLAGCLTTETVTCPDGRLCPAGMVCATGPSLCVTPEQKGACDGKSDGDECTFSNVSGRCRGDTCFSVGCGNGVVDPELGEACDDGPANADSKNACRTDCKLPRCGDNIIDDGEVCDSGDANGDTPNLCRADCRLPSCGDGVIDNDFDEECDQGPNNSNAGACHSNCRSPRCGDGIVDLLLAEQCDDAESNGLESSPCRADCMLVGCGNGIIDVGEDCDDGILNANVANTCRTSCKNPRCGDGIKDSNEPCDQGTLVNTPNVCRVDCQLPRCGDHIVDTNEFCDDGNNVSSDGCSADCGSFESCGNGVIDSARGETCDDFALSSHDGCSSDCQVESLTWAIQTQQQPYLRSQHAMVFDAARARVVLFGGLGNGLRGDTWLWDGLQWTQSNSPTSPSPRQSHAMAYDPVHEVVVLYGGGTSTWKYDDTWLWNGRKWTASTQNINPGALTGHAMVFDGSNNETILFGGISSAGTYPSETWRWSGTHWSSTSPLLSPSPRIGHRMAYDVSRKIVTLFGGIDENNVLLNDVWTWDGTTWTDVTPMPPAMSPSPRRASVFVHDAANGVVTLFGGHDGVAALGLADVWDWNGSSWISRTLTGAAPASRFDHAATYDPQRAQLVIFGGARNGTISLTDTWASNGSAWTQLVPPYPGPPPLAWLVRPQPRKHQAMAYDAGRGKTVIFGGIDGSTRYGDTWEWNAGAWKRVATTGPAARNWPAMAYDARRGKTVLFGGENGTYYADTWEWNGAVWQNVTPAGGATFSPRGRNGHGMAYDAERGKVVLFGGYSSTAPNFIADTWQWDGATWTNVTPALPADSPSGRNAVAMAFDAERRKVILFGGYATTNFSGETWEWNGSVWRQPPTITRAPAARNSTSLVYNPRRKTLVLFGGTDDSPDILDDTWEWDGTNWSELEIFHPSTRLDHAMAFDAVGARVLLFGGSANASSSALSETWQLRYDLPQPGLDEACHSGLDVDGDSLIGCADSDCIGYCDPWCATFGASSTLCTDDARPHCGDLLCDSANAIETCRSCPQDCGACASICGDFFCEGTETIATCPNDCR